MYFSATKQVPSTRVVEQQPSAHRRRFRLLLTLTVTTVVLAFWVIWRLSDSGETVYRLPAVFTEALNLLTLSAIATVGSLWLLVVYQYWQARSQALGLSSVAELQALSPSEFEQFSAEIFRARGYSVDVRGRSGDLGVDLEITNGGGKRAIAQCKRYRATVGPDIIRELYGTMIHERVSHAFLITTADISDGAREWAAGKPLTLIDGTTLIELANNAHVVPE